MSRARILIVTQEDADRRLDRWFRNLFPHVPQSRIGRMCRKGEIRVDGGRAKPATRLSAGQNVRVPPLPETDDDPCPPSTQTPVSEADAHLIRSSVIFRDEHIIALNKPPGLPVQGGTGHSRHVDGLAEALRFGSGERPRLVHRLDKDTSGVLILARTRTSARELTAAFRSRGAHKIYWAAVAGVPSPRAGTIRFGLVKAPGRGTKGEGERMRCVHPDEVEKTPGARHAITEYMVLAALGARVSWLALTPVTGRTHQLRTHMAGIGHPIAGDGKYGGSGQENPGDGWGAQLGGGIARTPHLHARSLTLRHPASGEWLNLTAELPDHMKRTWDMLGWRPEDAPDDPFAQEA